MFGMTTFVGAQGSGKTISLVEKIRTIQKKKYPVFILLRILGYIHQNEPLNDWQAN